MAGFELLPGVRAADPAAWNGLVGDESPFLEWEWLASLEESAAATESTGWAARPLVFRDGGRIVAGCPLYVKGHSEGEFVFDWGFADAAERAGLEYYPKLLVGVPFTPVTGRRLLTAPGVDRAAWLPRLAEALRDVCLENRLSGVHVNFCREDERAALAAAGFLPRLGFQYHWRNEGFESFEAYLGSLRSKRRNQVRRERRELDLQGVRIETRNGDAIPDALFPPMFRIYLSTIRTNPWGRQYLNQGFFELLRERFRHRLCFVGAWRGPELVAGAINVEKGGALYGRYWGAFQALRYLHFNVCYYAGIEHCIERGLERFEPGAGGDYKQLRGFDASPTWSCHFLAEPRLAQAVARFLERERAEAGRAIEWLTEHTSLRRDAPGRLDEVRLRLSAAPGSTPGART
jgi:uncharacterized protein